MYVEVSGTGTLRLRPTSVMGGRVVDLAGRLPRLNGHDIVLVVLLPDDRGTILHAASSVSTTGSAGCVIDSRFPKVPESSPRSRRRRGRNRGTRGFNAGTHAQIKTTLASMAIHKKLRRP